MYGGEAFEHEVQDYLALVGEACASADAGTMSNMKEHFLMCCKLEHMFWDQAQTLLQWPAEVSIDKVD